MRLFRKVQQFLFVATLFICLAPSTGLAADAAGDLPGAIGEVVSLMGTVTAKQPDGNTRKLDLNNQVAARDVIVTGCRSNVEIVFRDDSVLSQGPESSTSLDNFVYSDNPSTSKILFKMGTGTLRYVTGQIVKQNPDGFALATPSTTIGIRGTEVFVETTQGQEEIGVLGMTPGHEVEVSSQQDKRTIAKAGFSVMSMPGGRLSAPSPTDPKTRARVMKAAPQTTQGELGTTPKEKTDLDRKIDAFAAAAERTKGGLGGLDSQPDYSRLHNLNLQKAAQHSAESDRDTGGSGAGLGSDGGGGEGGGEGPE